MPPFIPPPSVTAAGAVMTGPLVLAGDAVDDLEALSKRQFDEIARYLLGEADTTAVTQSRSLLLTDLDKALYCTNSTPIELLIPVDAGLDFDDGATITVIRSAATVHVMAHPGVTLTAPDGVSLGSFRITTLTKTGTNAWTLSGEGLTAGTVDTLVSDGFSGGDVSSMGSHTPDLAFGGTAGLTYTGSGGGAIGITSGKAVRITTGQRTTALNPGAADVWAFVRVDALPSADFVRLIVRQNATLSTITHYAAQVSTTQVKLVTVTAGTATDIGSATALAAGDWIAVRVKGTRVTLFKNGVILTDATDSSVTGNTRVGFRQNTSTTGYQLDDLVVREVAA